MIPLTPSFLIAAATTLVGRRVPVESCTALVHHVGYWSHFEHGAAKSSWPFAANWSCADLAKYAKDEKVLQEEPLAGDVFLVWHPPTTSFEHAGIVARVREAGLTPGRTPWFACDTIEGRTAPRDHPDGQVVAIEVVTHIRRFYPTIGDRFIRWADLDRRWMAGQPFIVRPRSPRAA